MAAKAAGPVEDKQIMLMLQTLLAERFKLALHRETREMAVYALVASKDGSKLKQAESDGNSRTRSRRGRITAEHTSMVELADAMKRLTGLRVVDMTGLQGVFDFTLEWDPSTDPASGRQNLSPSMFTALQEQLGLRLEERKMPVEILVIDHVEKTPTEN
jgi:uncharacterized protein (TIGR03435 family)